MKLGELFIELGTRGNTKELEKTLKQLKQAEKETSAQIKLNKDLSKATSEEEKALIKKNYAQKKEIDSTEKVIQRNKERNKTIIDGVKGFTRFIGAVSLTIGVLDRLVNSSAKANQSILTLSQTSGVDVNTLNKYASAAKSVNYNVTRESVAQTFSNIASQLRQQSIGEQTNLIKGMALLTAKGGKPFTSYGLNATQFIENLRESIKGVNDEWVAEALSTMGISPDLIPMLRMSSNEFAAVKNRFLSEDQMREEQKRSLELQEKRDELTKTFERTVVDLYPLLQEIFNQLVLIAPPLMEVISELLPILTEIVKLLAPISRWLNKWFASHDISNLPSKTQEEVIETRTGTQKAKIEMEKAFGKNKLMGSIVSGMTSLAERIVENGIISGAAENAVKGNVSNSYRNMNNTFNNTIYTTQPADKVMMDNYERSFTQRNLQPSNY